MRLRFDRPHRVFFLAASVLAPFACVNSSDTPPPPPAFDAGPGYDAQGVDTSVPDVAVPDGSAPDSPAEAEAGPTTASVTVLAGVGGAPKAGVTVVFSDASGNLVDTKTTGADGKATATAAPGGMITVAVGGLGRRELFTFVGVKAGDDLVAFDVAVAPPTPPELSVDLPANPPPTAVRYDVYSGVCAGQGAVSPVLNQLFDACYRGGKAPVVAIATDANFARVAFAYKKGNPIEVDGGLAQVTGLGPWSTTLGTYNVAVTNAPAAIQSVQFASVEVADSVSFPQYLGNPLEAGSGSATFPTLPGYADWFQPQVMVNTPANGGALQAYVFSARRVAPAASGATETFDLSQLLPAISTLDFDRRRPPVDRRRRGRAPRR